MEPFYATDRGTNFTLFDTLNFDGRILQSRGDYFVKEIKFLTWSEDQQSLSTNVEIFVTGNDDKMEHKQTDTYSMEDGKLVMKSSEPEIYRFINSLLPTLQLFPDLSL